MPALAVDDLRKSYGEVQALDRASLHVGPGEMVGFLGPNGAGKTTTMRSILGLVSVDEGTITWDGETVNESHRRRIGYMPQERGLYARMKVHEQVAYFGRLAGLDAAESDRRADHWIERVDLIERRDSLLQELSVGNQQRVQLAVALVHQPPLLVLDEPFAGLDPVAVANMSTILAEQIEDGVSVVFSSHQLNLVQDICENVTVISAGRTVASGTVTELRERSERREFEVLWAEPPPDGWTPTPDATMTVSTSEHSRFHVPAGADASALVAAAAQAGTIRSVSFEPPGLDDVFLELVGS